MTQRRALRDENAASMRVMDQQINLKIEAIEIARAEVAMAEANLANAEAVVDQKQAALDQAEVDRERTQICAPIGGVIVKRDVNPGQTVAVTLEAKTLFKIAHDLREMEVRGRIDEADVGKLSVGQTATFSVDAYPGRLFKGHVLQIRKSPEITQNVVTYIAIISAPNPDLLLLPGMTATLRVVVSETESTLKIPNQALRFRPKGEKAAVERAGRGSPTVWVIGQDRRPSPVPVTVGRSDNKSTELLSGELSEGQPGSSERRPRTRGRAHSDSAWGSEPCQNRWSGLPTSTNITARVTYYPCHLGCLPRDRARRVRRRRGAFRLGSAAEAR